MSKYHHVIIEEESTVLTFSGRGNGLFAINVRKTGILTCQMLFLSSVDCRQSTIGPSINGNYFIQHAADFQAWEFLACTAVQNVRLLQTAFSARMKSINTRHWNLNKKYYPLRYLWMKQALPSIDGDFGKLGSNISPLEWVDSCLKNPANFSLIEGMFQKF